MKLSDFQKKYKHHCNKGLSFHVLSHLPELANFDFDVWLPSKQMNLQRGLVWTIEQKRALIFTILRDQRIAPFVVVQNDKDGQRRYNWQVIDGKQRINSIFEFFNDEFSIVFDGIEYLYSQLPPDCKRQVERYSLFTVDVHYSYDDDPISDQTKIDLFEEINWLGTPQDIEHFNKIKNA